MDTPVEAYPLAVTALEAGHYHLLPWLCDHLGLSRSVLHPLSTRYPNCLWLQSHC
jgi:hypothetical protein